MSISISPRDDLTVMNISEHPFTYNCKDGFCGDCRCELVEGSVRYKDEPLAWLESNEIVPCKAIPETNLILREVLK